MNASQVTAFSESGDNVVVGFFNDAESAEAKEFLKAADKIEDALFGVSYDEKVCSLCTSHNRTSRPSS